jgi:predicted Zn-dependent protease
MARITFLIAVIYLMCLPGTSSAEYNPVTGKDEPIYVSTEQEVEMGDSIAKKVEAVYKLDPDKHVQERAEIIGNRLAKFCDRKELIFHFKVLAVDDINAVSLPGGWVYVFRGLIEVCKNDDELAGVIAHEIGHIAARHHMKKLQQSSVANIAMILVAATQGSNAANATNLAITSLMASYSREDEFEADKRSVIYTKAAGYDPRGVLTFMETMKKEKKFDIRPYSYFKTHPYVGERMGKVESAIEGRSTFREWINKPLDNKW